MVLVTTVCNAILCDFLLKNAKAQTLKICVAAPIAKIEDSRRGVRLVDPKLKVR